MFFQEGHAKNIVLIEKKMCKKKVTENAGLVSMKTVSPSTSSILLSFFAYFSIIRFTKMVPSFHGLRPCPLFPAFLSKNLRKRPETLNPPVMFNSLYCQLEGLITHKKVKVAWHVLILRIHLAI